ncbi:MAG TPA: DUF763 domain-containing protein, partial [Spirochaetota bacterium]|nr:DUF763 domain-containing protein [Spirochaetota bacterium]
MNLTGSHAEAQSDAVSLSYPTAEGKWAVVQQGMNDASGMARRYHWHSDEVKSFVSDPHSAIEGENMGEILNLSDSRADSARSSIVDFLS